MGGSVVIAEVREIVRKIRARDEHGLRLWWDRIGPKLAGALAAFCGRPPGDELIDAAMGDTLISVWFQISSFKV